MTRRAVPLALALLAAAAVPPAAAEPGQGVLCGYSLLLDDPVADGVRLSGEIDGGPVVLAADGAPATGRIVCSLQVDAARHDAADLVRVASATTPGAAWLPPTTFAATVPDDAYVFHCTEVQVDGGGTYYWDADGRRWTTDATAPCDDMHPDGEPGQPGQELFEEVVDPVVCGPMAALLPPEGDIDGLWDCPPYDWETS